MRRELGISEQAGGRGRRLTAQVVNVATPSPRLRRVSLVCPGLGAARPVIPGAWVRIYVPDDSPGAPAAGSREIAGLAPRPYTITNWRPATAEFQLDFVLHGQGPASRWAASAAIGDTLPLSGPLGRFQFDDAASKILLAGDLTALPAIRELVRATPTRAQVQAQVEAAPTDRMDPALASEASIEWRAPGELADLAEAAALLPADWHVGDPGLRIWIGAEASEVATIRRALLAAGLPQPHLHATAYWRR